MAKRKLIKSKYGVEIYEDTEIGKLFYLIDGYSVFSKGIPKQFSKFVDQSFDELVEQRKKDYDEDNQQ